MIYTQSYGSLVASQPFGSLNTAMQCHSVMMSNQNSVLLWAHISHSCNTRISRCGKWDGAAMKKLGISLSHQLWTEGMLLSDAENLRWDTVKRN